VPAKIFFISVEGNITEKEYFEQLSKFREKLGINAKVDVEVLKRAKNDTNSAPKQVIELLEEYVKLRACSITEIEEELFKEFEDKYSKEIIKSYINDEKNFDFKTNENFISDLKMIGYDLAYRKYLLKYNNEFDEFAIIIDRDKETHSEKNMIDCVAHCIKKGYLCFISNPCFEFWLLMHLKNIKQDYAGKMEVIKENRKISKAHTYVSKEVSDIAKHGKSNLNFEDNYLTRVDYAINQANAFALTNQDLIMSIGSNIGELISKMKNHSKFIENEECKYSSTGSEY
jgi:hypothetical protein